MRIGRVLGNVTLSRRLPELRPGQWLIVEPLDHQALVSRGHRATPDPESLVVYDELGAGQDQWIAISEGAEATMPFRPRGVPIDAYNAAILDTVEMY